MTPAALNRIITTWQKRLKIEHIALKIDLSQEPDNPDALAAVIPSELYDYAELIFRGDWSEHSPFELNRIVVHELLHVMFRDFGQAMRSIGQAGILSHQTQLMWHDRCSDSEEALIDRLAHRLVELGGVVR